MQCCTACHWLSPIETTLWGLEIGATLWPASAACLFCADLVSMLGNCRRWSDPLLPSTPFWSCVPSPRISTGQQQVGGSSDEARVASGTLDCGGERLVEAEHTEKRALALTNEWDGSAGCVTIMVSWEVAAKRCLLDRHRSGGKRYGKWEKRVKLGACGWRWFGAVENVHWRMFMDGGSLASGLGSVGGSSPSAKGLG